MIPIIDEIKANNLHDDIEAKITYFYKDHMSKFIKIMSRYDLIR